MTEMLDRDVVSFLQSGCALIVGTVGVDGTPAASRAWGLDVDAEQRTARVLVSSADPLLRQHLVPSAKIAVSASSTVELRLMEIKGPIEHVVAATDEDRERSRRYRDELHGMLVDLEQRSRPLLDRLVPAEMSACVFRIDKVINRTPRERS